MADAGTKDAGRKADAAQAPLRDAAMRADAAMRDAANNDATAGDAAAGDAGSDTSPRSVCKKGASYGVEWANAYTTDRYHKPADEYDASWDLSGMVGDFTALYRVGRELVDGDAWPNWYEGNEFRAVRDAAMRGKATAAQ